MSGREVGGVSRAAVCQRGGGAVRRSPISSRPWPPVEGAGTEVPSRPLGASPLRRCSSWGDARTAVAKRGKEKSSPHLPVETGVYIPIIPGDVGEL